MNNLLKRSLTGVLSGLFIANAAMAEEPMEREGIVQNLTPNRSPSKIIHLYQDADIVITHSNGELINGANAYFVTCNNGQNKHLAKIGEALVGYGDLSQFPDSPSYTAQTIKDLGGFFEATGYIIDDNGLIDKTGKTISLSRSEAGQVVTFFDKVARSGERADVQPLNPKLVEEVKRRIIEVCNPAIS